MKDEIAEPLLDALRACVRKLTRVQLETEGARSVPYPEVARAEEVIAAFTGDAPRMTIAEGAVYETFDAALTRLAAFADEFRRAAQTPYQHQLAGDFQTFVGELGRSMFGRDAERPEPDRER